MSQAVQAHRKDSRSLVGSQGERDGQRKREGLLPRKDLQCQQTDDSNAGRSFN